LYKSSKILINSTNKINSDLNGIFEIFESVHLKVSYLNSHDVKFDGIVYTKCCSSFK